MIDGLSRRADLNGSIGVITSYSNEQQRLCRLPTPRRSASARTTRRRWDDDGEVYDAYQDDDDAYYEDEGEAEAVCYGGAVIEDLD